MCALCNLQLSCLQLGTWCFVLGALFLVLGTCYVVLDALWPPAWYKLQLPNLLLLLLLHLLPSCICTLLLRFEQHFVSHYFKFYGMLPLCTHTHTHGHLHVHTHARIYAHQFSSSTLSGVCLMVVS